MGRRLGQNAYRRKQERSLQGPTWGDVRQLWIIGWSYVLYLRCVQGKHDMKGEGAGGSIGGDKRHHRNNFSPPWHYLERLRGIGVVGRMPRSRNQTREGGRVGKSACWDVDERHPGGKTTSCGRRMNSCGSYGGD